MKTKYKHIYFALQDQKPKTQIWAMYSNQHNYGLGLIKWDRPWRQYCFYPLDETVFSKGCLNDINDFIDQLNEERKKNK